MKKKKKRKKTKHKTPNKFSNRLYHTLIRLQIKFAFISLRPLILDTGEMQSHTLKIKKFYQLQEVKSKILWKEKTNVRMVVGFKLQKH